MKKFFLDAKLSTRLLKIIHCPERNGHSYSGSKTGHNVLRYSTTSSGMMHLSRAQFFSSAACCTLLYSNKKTALDFVRRTAAALIMHDRVYSVAPLLLSVCCITG